MRRLATLNWLGLLTMAGALVLWQALVQSGALDYEYVPAPSEVAAAAGRLTLSGELAQNAGHTLRVVLLGWTAAAVVGIALGVALGLSHNAWRWTMASLEAVRAMPPICLVPVALLLFGFSVRMELTIIVYASAWPVMLNTIDGVRGVRPEVLEVARMLRLSRLQTLRKIVVPAALPLTIVGLRLALSFALVLAIVAEVAGNPSGLGNAIVSAQQALRPDEMFAYVLAIGALGVTLNAAFNLLAARVVAIPGGARTFARPA
jgi:ABC-type nitrate/sulfonate/bicarbonate transport system permease component